MIISGTKGLKGICDCIVEVLNIRHIKCKEERDA